MEKICSKCSTSKHLADFHKNPLKKDGLHNHCKACKKTYYLEHKKTYQRYYQNHKEKLQEGKRNYRGKNKEKLNKEANEYVLRRYRMDIQFRLQHNLRARLRLALKNNQKIGSAIEDLGCTIADFKLYLESRFIEGMTWDNYGQWHIDHIRPLSVFNLSDKEQVKTACHYTNLQPLWALDNMQKGNRIDSLKNTQGRRRF